MSWTAMLLLSAGNLLQRLAGMFLVGRRLADNERAARLIGLVPVAIVAAVAAVQTFAVRQQLTIDARVPGVAVAAIAAWRRLPLVVVVLLAAGTTAGVRALGLAS
ncbi:MAG: AzlD domain-containing protein [Acidimicrobiales bacterium]